jgi:lysophospholipase L1-like esterase
MATRYGHRLYSTRPVTLFSEYPNTPSGIFTYDGNHFNQAGHQFVAEQMLTKLK